MIIKSSWYKFEFIFYIFKRIFITTDCEEIIQQIISYWEYQTKIPIKLMEYVEKEIKPKGMISK